jgi:hypothetical protein
LHDFVDRKMWVIPLGLCWFMGWGGAPSDLAAECTLEVAQDQQRLAPAGTAAMQQANIILSAFQQLVSERASFQI